MSGPITTFFQFAERTSAGIHDRDQNRPLKSRAEWDAEVREREVQVVELRALYMAAQIAVKGVAPTDLAGRQVSEALARLQELTVAFALTPPCDLSAIDVLANKGLDEDAKEYLKDRDLDPRVREQFMLIASYRLDRAGEATARARKTWQETHERVFQALDECRPMACNGSAPPAAPQPAATPDPLAAFATAIDTAGLKGVERQVALLVCSKGGRVRIADAATALDQSDVVSAAKRAGGKLKREGWLLYRDDGCIVVKARPAGLVRK